jgi:hypothetical protein
VYGLKEGKAGHCSLDYDVATILIANFNNTSTHWSSSHIIHFRENMRRTNMSKNMSRASKNRQQKHEQTQKKQVFGDSRAGGALAW